MKIVRIVAGLKRQVTGLLTGITFGLATCGVASAMSTLVSVTIEPQWPDSTDPGNVVLYKVTVTRAGEGDISVALSATGLPDGATNSFSINPIRFTGNVPTQITTILTIACTNLIATDAYPFVVTGVAERQTLSAVNPAAATFDAIFAANPASRPTLSIDLLGRRNMKIRGKGATGKAYKIEASQTLSAPSWGSIGTSRADGNGRFSYLDSNAQAPDVLFYRSAGPVR
jgi:hypothetical protein